MQPSEQIAAIIGKKLEGQASPEELAELQVWINADAANSAEYDQLAKIWADSPRALRLPAFDTATAWQKLDGIIRSNTRKAPAKIISLYRRVAVAAAVIIIAGAGWWLYSSRVSWQRVEALAANQTIHLPDGTDVELRQGSMLEYPRSYGRNDRRVHLTGEAFFNVQRNDQQPFEVNTARAQVEVLGTSFLVRSENALEEVVVATGRVRVTDRDQSSHQVELVAGQKAVLAKGQISQSAVTGTNYMAWKTGVLEFTGTPLAQVLEDVSHFYHTSLSLAPGQESFSGTEITIRLENEPFESALEELKQVTGLDVKKENGKIFLYRK
ncbi:MAG: FecR domain-containing protein [Bacteroidetes bacterium]|nr:FecR domain-containing protein [Bacteroidota bacterium]